MFKKYSLPFLILGIGIGIILTNTIYEFNSTVEYKEASEEEIIEQAKDLGMVFLKENIEVSTKREEGNIDPEEETDSEESEQEMEDKAKKEIVEKELIIESGYTLEEVAKDLYDLGIIDNIQAFHKLAIDRGVDKKLRVGTYKISNDSGYETLIKILTKSLW